MEFIKSNWSIIFSGFGVTLLLIILGSIPKMIKFFRTLKIIKKSEYDDLLRIKSNYVDLDELKKGLEFNHEYGIYRDNKADENFCPTCLTNKKVRNHLMEEMTDFGTVYRCPVCPQIFRDKGYGQRVQQENDKYLNNF